MSELVSVVAFVFSAGTLVIVFAFISLPKEPMQ